MTHQPPSRRSVLGLLGVAPVAAGAVWAGTGRAHPEPSQCGRIPKDLRPGGAYDRFVADLAAADKFSGTILLAYRGKPVLARAYGMADKAESIRNRMDTLFDLGSITKCFTATAIMQLAQQNKIAFHEKLGTYLDGFPTEVADTVTIHQLLTHTSGVGRPPIQIGPPDPEQQEWDSVEEVWDGTLKIIRSQPLQFTPGTKYQYSNDGFIVLGAIVQEVSGQNYYDYIREHVFTPAGMKRTDFYTRPQLLAATDIAHPYRTHPETGERIDSLTNPPGMGYPFVGNPAGGAFSTASELLAFVGALQEPDTLLASAFADLATSGKMVTPPEEKADLERQNSFYGYGFVASILNDRRICGHSGGSTLGVANMLDFFPDLDWVSVSLCNYDERNHPMVNLGRNLITAQ